MADLRRCTVCNEYLDCIGQAETAEELTILLQGFSDHQLDSCQYYAKGK